MNGAGQNTHMLYGSLLRSVNPPLLHTWSAGPVIIWVKAPFYNNPWKEVQTKAWLMGQWPRYILYFPYNIGEKYS